MELWIDGQALSSMEELHDLFAGSLSFPAYYGRNLSALFDRLTELGEETTLHISGWDTLEKTLGPKALPLRRLLLDAETENPRLTILFESTP